MALATRNSRISGCLKYAIGAALCSATAYLCVEPFLKHRSVGGTASMSLGEWLLAFLVIPGIILTGLMCLAAAGTCIVLAFRSLVGTVSE
jgi:hypothetical protein